MKEPSLEALDVGPWVERFSFGQKDDIVRDKDGLYGAFATTEDWEMSLRWSAWGIKVMATRKVRIGHIGSHQWTYGGKNGAEILACISISPGPASNQFPP